MASAVLYPDLTGAYCDLIQVFSHDSFMKSHYIEKG